MSIDIRILSSGEENVLTAVGADVFDDPIDARATREFLADPRHHIAVAIDGGVVVGFTSGVHYVHPDKHAPELWINEVSVAATHRGRGIARDLLRALLQHARSLGCAEAWVLTDRSNPVAMRLYAASGGVVSPLDVVMYEFPLDDRGAPTA